MIYRNTVTIQRLNRNDLGGGSFSETYSDHFVDILATVQPVSQIENIKAGRETSNKSFRFYLQPTTGVTMEDRVVWDGNTYEITELQLYPNTYLKLIGQIVV